MKIKIAIIGLCMLGFSLLVMKLPAKHHSLPTLSEKVLKKCSGSQPTEVCYDNEIPKLMKFLSMEDAFAVTSLVQNKDQSFPYCHVLGHKLASIETQKDPSSWRDVVARCPSGVCSNGCVHGAFQEKYKDETLNGQTFIEAKKEFNNLCEERQSFKMTGLAQGSCYHALGHLLMYVTDANINKSVETCDEVAKKKDGRDFSPLCYDGAFMQIFQPLDTDDQSLVKNFMLEKDDVQEFCNKFSGEKKVSCWTESWPLFLTEISKAKGLVNFCSELDSKGREDCFEDILYIMPIQFRFNLDSISKYCTEFPQPYQSKCFSMTASRIFEIDRGNVKKAIDYCEALVGDNKHACFDKITDDADFNFDPKSAEFSQICSQLPDPWKNKCNQKSK